MRKHVLLHGYLDELVADMIRSTYMQPSKTTVHELMEWSYRQTIDPEEKDDEPEIENDADDPVIKGRNGDTNTDALSNLT
jgi:hypothetical protein